MAGPGRNGRPARPRPLLANSPAVPGTGGSAVLYQGYEQGIGRSHIPKVLSQDSCGCVNLIAALAFPGTHAMFCARTHLG
jgi:hypothetical protein